MSEKVCDLLERRACHAQAPLAEGFTHAVAKTRLSQKELKNLYGAEIKAYAIGQKMIDPVEESLIMDLRHRERQKGERRISVQHRDDVGITRPAQTSFGWLGISLGALRVPVLHGMGRHAPSPVLFFFS